MIRNGLKLCAVAGVASFAILLSACSTTTPGSTTASKATKITKIGFTVSDLSNPFFSAMEQEVNAQAKKVGATVNAQDGRQNLSAQNSQIATFIQQGVQVIYLDAVDSKGIGPAVLSAEKAGIIVIALGDNASDVDAFVGVDNTQAGSVACKELATKIGGSGDIAIIDGTAISAVQDRVTGCNDALKAFPNVHLVASPHGDNSIGTGQTVAADVLTAHPTLKGLFGINDPTSLGAILAAKQANKTDLTIVSVDGSPAAITELKTAGSMLYGTASQDPRAMAAEGMVIAQKLIKGGTLDNNQDLLPSKFITADNVSSYQGWQ